MSLNLVAAKASDQQPLCSLISGMERIYVEV